jgi:hypothetical protein
MTSRAQRTIVKDMRGTVHVMGMDTIRSVGIVDLAQVQSHHINHVMGSV